MPLWLSAMYLKGFYLSELLSHSLMSCLIVIHSPVTSGAKVRGVPPILHTLRISIVFAIH